MIGAPRRRSRQLTKPWGGREDDRMKDSKRKPFSFETGAVIAFCLVGLIVLAVPNLLGQEASEANKEYYSIIEDVFDFIQNNYVEQVDPKALYEGALKGMFESLNDPYSLYLDEKLMSDLNDTTTGKFGGVGLYISKEEKDPRYPDRDLFIEVVSPIEDSPGWKAGISPGDLIIKIGEDSTAGFSSDDAVKRLRGEPNTTVNVILRRGKAEFPVSLKRAFIEVPTVKKAIIPGGVGYLRIIEFTPQTVGRVREAISSFTDAKCRAVCIDLRNNGGGRLDSVVQIADFFLEQGIIVSTKSRNPADTYSFNAKSDLLLPKDVPMIVLTNKGSASASEILAGALKDHKRAYIMGETSYGKGSVQQVYPIGRTGFKMTMSRYYTPSDANIDKTGITPDQEVSIPPMSDAQMAQITDLLTKGTLKDWAEKNPAATKVEIGAYVSQLALKDFGGYEWVVERMVRDEINRKSIAPVYDLDYDFVLRAAIKLFDDKGPKFPELFKTTKTVRQVQDEEAAKNLTAKGNGGEKKIDGGLPLPKIDK